MCSRRHLPVELCHRAIGRLEAGQRQTDVTIWLNVDRSVFSDSEMSAYHDSSDENENRLENAYLVDQKNEQSCSGGQCDMCRKCGLMAEGKSAPEDSAADSIKNLIVGGKSMKPPYKYPFLVSMLDENSTICCGGALISPTFVITAGHCIIKDTSMLRMRCRTSEIPADCFVSPNERRIGTIGPGKTSVPKQVLKVKRIIPSPNYNLKSQQDDIALVELAEPAPCSNSLIPACLPQQDLHKMNRYLQVAGWGKTKKNDEGEDTTPVLREGKVKQVPTRKCRKADILWQKALKRTICTSNKESDGYSCKGDSGSALFASFDRRFYALGVTSRQTDVGCKPNGYVIFTKVFPHIRWIQATVKDLPEPDPIRDEEAVEEREARREKMRDLLRNVLGKKLWCIHFVTGTPCALKRFLKASIANK